MSNLVVKTNRLNTATQNLSLTEVRIMQLAIVDARETGLGLTSDSPLTISSSRYAEAFGVTRQTAYEVILKAEKTLFDRRFSFLDDDDKMVKSRWVQRVKYLDDEASIEVILTYDVVKEVTRIDGYEQFFTQYLLEQTAHMNSAYSVRLYELLVQWKTAKKTPVFNIEVFREQLGVEPTEYNRIYDFKKNVVDLAVNEINQKTDLKVSYEQKKKGRKIVGFEFAVLTNKKTNKKEVGIERDANTADMFTI
ncbi:replication initiation protein RepM, partial [Psychrobacter faecalis]